ncbi:hypothetical protein WA026_016029 [Henosepilachna vigintioctopunctata]|uniref:EF-hand domain-containing protein n=1 Tax=Henosepilachna vigintioctopunctata TaxID=420089 RepID=A0AAW1TZM4_9CUCU
MDSATLDPYEQQLLAVFNRYDYSSVGSLDVNGLTELCHTLQLQEQGTELIQSLLGESQKSRVKFIEFKDALLTLLGNLQKKHNNSEEIKESENKGSPDREVSPKYIYGSKKYGRRSRPKTDLNLDEQNDLNFLNTSKSGKDNTVQRSNSEVCNSKKRKTNFKLKRCTSLPSRDEQNSFVQSFPHSDSFSDENEFICTEEMLRKAWQSLGVGEDGYLNQTELILVCDAIGLHNLASGVIRQLSDKISFDYNHKISFQELLEALKHDETWSDILNTSESTVCNEPLSAVHATDTSFPDSQTFQFISLGPDGNGIISADTVIDMWESVGITAPKELLHELGFNSRKLSVSELSSVLDSGLKTIRESNENTYSNPHISLLQANLTLYQCEIKCLKNIMEQLNAERDKLKYDITEANNRATLLAQEVDDNHQKMQENTQNQVKLLEQRHSDILKNLSKQFLEEKEELNQFNYKLEQKICNLELESSKLKNDLAAAKKYLSSVEIENNQLNCKVADLHQSKNLLQEQVVILESECQKYSELEHEKIKPLLEKLNRLEIENGHLRDQSDEMGAEIETLNNQIMILRGKGSASPVRTLDESMENNILLFCDGNGCGSKRRNDESPSKDASLFNSNLNVSSPRLGKIRKIPKNAEERPTSSESGFCTEVEYSDNSFCLSPSAESKEIKRLQAKIIFLEQVLQQHNLTIPSDDDLETVWTNVNNVNELKCRVNCLESIINDIRQEFRKIEIKDGDTKPMIEKLSKMIVQDDLLGTKIYEMRKNNSEIKEKVCADVSTATEDQKMDIAATMKQLEEQNKDLTEKCSELENCIDLLKNEYEKCEDYWANKLDEERQIFEQEQSQSNEKFVELFNKMSEYEEQFAQSDSRLPTIAETYNLEKQFTDLEEEYENYKSEMEILICSKDDEIVFLKQKLTELALDLQNRTTSDASVQVDELNEYTIIAGKMMQLTSHVVECSNFSPLEAIPGDWTASESSAENKASQYYQPPDAMVGRQDSLDGTNAKMQSNIKWGHNDIQTSIFPSTSSSSVEKSSAPCRPKRTRKHERDAHQYKKCYLLGSKEDGPSKEHNVPALLASIQSLNARRLHLEQRCRHLQVVLKEQHYQTERTLQQCWQNQQSERAEFHCMLKVSQEKLEQYMRAYKELSEKLTKTDLLVKELYVENSYLIANVQRLEQHRHILAQCSTNNSL